ncbi:MAG: DoxX family protein [Leptospiraceae bacterium]|nr:DoxX family protein [Leptospiraceae bacterium]MCB1303527.1 DoxX family protein [Leptospiraceae bacterium]
MLGTLKDILKPYAPYAPTLLRWVTGIFLLAHGIPKLFHVPIFLDSIAQNIVGFPLNYIVGIGTLIVENLLAIFLILGFKVRESALFIACWFFGVSFVAHGANIIELFNLNSGDDQVKFEYPFLLAVNCLVLAIRGAGRLGFDPED